MSSRTRTSIVGDRMSVLSSLIRGHGLDGLLRVARLIGCSPFCLLRIVVVAVVRLRRRIEIEDAPRIELDDFWFDYN